MIGRSIGASDLVYWIADCRSLGIPTNLVLANEKSGDHHQLPSHPELKSHVFLPAPLLERKFGVTI